MLRLYAVSPIAKRHRKTANRSAKPIPIHMKIVLDSVTLFGIDLCMLRNWAKSSDGRWNSHQSLN